jgi:2-phosphosulfolactate phosphatase
VAGFLNAAVVVDFLSGSNQPVELICAGTNGEFSLDDFLCAGLIADSLTSEVEMTQNDLVHLAIKTWREAKSDVHKALENCHHYNILKNKGFKEDLEYCLTRDLFRILPFYDPQEGTIRLISC